MDSNLPLPSDDLPTGLVIATPELTAVNISYGWDGPLHITGRIVMHKAHKYIDFARHSETLKHLILLTPSHTIVLVRCHLVDRGRPQKALEKKEDADLREFELHAFDARILNNRPDGFK